MLDHYDSRSYRQDRGYHRDDYNLQSHDQNYYYDNRSRGDQRYYDDDYSDSRGGYGGGSHRGRGSYYDNQRSDHHSRYTYRAAHDQTQSRAPSANHVQTTEELLYVERVLAVKWLISVFFGRKL